MSDGWILGRKVVCICLPYRLHTGLITFQDNSDGQYSSFRENVPVLALLLILHPLLRRAYDTFWRSNSYTGGKTLPGQSSKFSHGLSTAAAADVRLEQRAGFDFFFAIILVTALHGVSSLKILAILYANYKIAKDVPRQYVPAATWLFNVGILFANELSGGYKFSTAAAMVFPTTSAKDGTVIPPYWAVWLDSLGGLIPRWEVLFKCTVLRMISFNMDYHWSLQSRSASPIEVGNLILFTVDNAYMPKKKQLDPAALSARDRISMPAKPADYSFRNFVAYALYSPLYIAGPIVTFNDYISQARYRADSITRERTFLYAIRFVVCFVTMELILHFIYVVAIFHAKPDWSSYSPLQLSTLGYFNLTIIWLKLLIPWRFFRLWALADGIDPPENMTRCMSNNYSTFAFWRGWHRSFNRWIVRYVYIPLGGSSWADLKGGFRSLANILVVFSFVAIWHDIKLQLLQWGWLVSLFLVPEFLATLAFPARKWRSRPDAYRWICGVGAVANVLMMMIANLVGFAIGIDGLKGLVQGIIGSFGGLTFLGCACGALFVGVQVMFEVRQQERREGIKMNC